MVKCFLISLAIVVCIVPRAFADFLVFHANRGTVANYENPTALAIKHQYAGKSPLKEALTKFFDGPTEFESENAGAIKAFRCINSRLNDGTSYGCGASDVFESVRIIDGIAHIDLLGVPAAPTSGAWMAFDIPFMLTVTQFSNVSGYEFYVNGRSVTGLDWGFGCEALCFHIPNDHSELDEMIKNQF